MRSDAILKCAGECLYLFSHEAIPAVYSHKEAIIKFVGPHLIKEEVSLEDDWDVPQTYPEEEIQKSIEDEKKTLENISKTDNIQKKELTHKIEEGDSLSVIAKKYKVSIEDIKRLNNLSSDTIRTGKTLIIPRNGSSRRQIDQSLEP